MQFQVEILSTRCYSFPGKDGKTYEAFEITAIDKSEGQRLSHTVNLSIQQRDTKERLKQLDLRDKRATIEVTTMRVGPRGNVILDCDLTAESLAALTSGPLKIEKPAKAAA